MNCEDRGAAHSAVAAGDGAEVREAARACLISEIDHLLLRSSLDHEEILEELGTLLVPNFADHYIIWFVDNDEWGRVVQVKPLPTDEITSQLLGRLRLERGGIGGLHRVLQRGESILYRAGDDGSAPKLPEDREHLGLFREIGISSAVLVPLIARGRIRGALAVFRSTSRDLYDSADLDLVVELATRVALSVDNALLHREVQLELLERKRIEAALRESEARFRVMADMAPVLIWMSDLEGRYHFFNKPWLEFTGRAIEEEEGDGWLEGVHPDDLEVYRSAYHEAFQRREPVAIEYRLRRFDGEYRWILDHGVPRFSADGEFAGYIGSCIDITPYIDKRRLLTENTIFLQNLTAELEKTIEELELRRREADEARAAADEANEAKGRFLAIMSHELRTPLNAILGYSDLLSAEVTGELNEAQHQQVQRIQESSLHLLELINRLLSFSRIEAGKEEIELERIDIIRLVHDTAALIVPQAEKKGLGIEIELPAGPIETETDPGKLRQILLNLLSNAVKFTEEGVVRFSGVVYDAEVVFEIADTGIGIPELEIGRIFEAFAQADQSTTRRRDGTGLGLSVSWELARLLGGEIEVESELDRGSTFTLRLPLPTRLVG